MKTVLSLAEVGSAERLGRVQGTVEEMLGQLRARFPEDQGYRYKVESRVAQWAWPRGTRQTEKQITASLDAGTRERAFRRGIRVTRGVTWGLTIDIQTTDREASGVKLAMLSESPLSIIVAVIGGVAGMGLTVAYACAQVPNWYQGSNLKLTMFAGFAVGGVLGGLCWLLARPLEGLKTAVVKELMEAMTQCVTRATSGGR